MIICGPMLIILNEFFVSLFENLSSDQDYIVLDTYSILVVQKRENKVELITEKDIDKKF
jgi:hypothetical protein